MTQKPFLTTLLGCLLLLAACKKENDRNSFTLQGKVIDYNTGTSIANAKIIITNLDLGGAYNEIVASGKSNASGDYSFRVSLSKIRADYYEFFSEAAGYSRICGGNGMFLPRTYIDSVKVITKNIELCY